MIKRLIYRLGHPQSSFEGVVFGIFLLLFGMSFAVLGGAIGKEPGMLACGLFGVLVVYRILNYIPEVDQDV